MEPSLVCILSYGLMCSPGDVVREVPNPTPLVAAADVDATKDVKDAAGDAEPVRGQASLLLAKVQSFYDASRDLEAKFTQTYVHPVYGTKTVSKGKLRVKKPGFMVWDYDKDENPDFYVEGDRIWVVERDTKQVITKDVGSSDIAGAEKFLFGGRQLIDDFQVKVAGETLAKRYGMAGHTVIQLKPKRKNAHYVELLLVVDDGTGRVDAFVVRNTDKSTNHFVLSDLSTNVGLQTSDVKFSRPKGYTLIKG
jgi:outer membrane lipoprotein carrier protein